jgi:uncharacterized protein YqgV (UPF0045/DUF77 family)
MNITNVKEMLNEMTADIAPVIIKVLAGEEERSVLTNLGEELAEMAPHPSLVPDFDEVLNAVEQITECLRENCPNNLTSMLVATTLAEAFTIATALGIQEAREENTEQPSKKVGAASREELLKALAELDDEDEVETVCAAIKVSSEAEAEAIAAKLDSMSCPEEMLAFIKTLPNATTTH